MTFELSKIEKEFNSYLEQLEEQFEILLINKAAENDQPLYLLKTYYMYMCFIADKPLLNQRHPTDKILFAKTSTDLFGIYNCLKSGCIYQALVIFRGLLETNVTTKFIYQEYEYRSHLYYDHKYMEKYQQYKKKPENVRQSEIEMIKKKYNEIKNKYNYNSFWYTKLLKEIIQKDAKLNHKHKGRPTIRAMADVAGILDEYDSMYSMMSKATHGSALLEHLFIQDNRLTTAPYFDESWFNNILGLSIQNGHNVLKTILEHDKSIDTLYVNFSNELLFYSLFQGRN
ncbi:DUF5677 domain-containing protein [Lysinibacillus fusiformis]|uniref:DUF5677 domain-containing protein n=1 Tax=Lysinibacillus fusiformis TaxID=28031 RepID=UPI0021BDF2CF|nr:DUF5677 domain-containing protein [Lysinibacillus fusiformis]UXJ68189.1 DUF5677 domain-containing protein [Lysinibacillus fusiformis]